MRTGVIIRRCKTGFLQDFAGDAAGNIHRVPADIVEVGCSRRKIDAACVRGVLTYFAEDECAVGATQRAHPEAVEDSRVRKTPVAPRQETGEIGLEIAGVEALASEDRIAPQQDTAVPDRLLA